MSNPPRAKGTAWEVELLGLLRGVWPYAERAPLKGHADRGDYVSVDMWLIEAKSTKVPRFLEWARQARRKAAGDPWAVVWHGDRRSEVGRPLVVLDLEMFLSLVYDEATKWGPR